MISRRLLRVKALQVLYAFNRKEGDDFASADKELAMSIAKAYDLYLYLLLLYTELTSVAENRIETGLQKNFPTSEDLNPNRRFVNNRIVGRLKDCDELTAIARDRKITWTGHEDIPRVLYSRMSDWPEFSAYLNSSDDSIVSDRKFLSNLLTGLLLETEDLLLHLEEMSIYWNDDLEFAVIMIEKTLKRIREDQEPAEFLMPLFKNEDDEKFASGLLINSLLRDSEIRQMIDRNTTNWEIERIALMDILVMQLAITEIMVFPEIPVKVTLNEYIEIAKYYCTAKSSTFINGILDKVVKELKDKGMFEKTGRGLIGENEFKDQQ
ncbi:MAG: transcription antitermination factor NusB [Bacteroidales bacterium]